MKSIIQVTGKLNWMYSHSVFHWESMKKGATFECYMAGMYIIYLHKIDARDKIKKDMRTKLLRKRE